MVTLILLISAGVVLICFSMEKLDIGNYYAVVTYKIAAIIIMVCSLIVILALVIVSVLMGKPEEEIKLYQEKNEKIVIELNDYFEEKQIKTDVLEDEISIIEIIDLEYNKLKTDSFIVERCKEYKENESKVKFLKTKSVEQNFIKHLICYSR